MNPDRLLVYSLGVWSLVAAGTGYEIQAITVGIFALTLAVDSLHVPLRGESHDE